MFRFNLYIKVCFGTIAHKIIHRQLGYKVLVNNINDNFKYFGVLN